jgi:cyclic-di-AMP phosphodiesterase PgpH
MPANGYLRTWLRAQQVQRLFQWTARARRFFNKNLPPWAQILAGSRWERWALIGGTSVIAAFMLAPRDFRVYNLAVGEPAKETIVSPMTFQVVDEAATNKNRDEVLNSVRPMYDLDDEMAHDVQARISSAFRSARDYLDQEAKHRSQEGPNAKEPESTTTGSSSSTGAPSFRPLDENELRMRFENDLNVSISSVSFNTLKSVGFNTSVERVVGRLVVTPLSKGVVMSRELLTREGKRGILLRVKTRDKLEPLRDLSTIFDLNEAIGFINMEEKDPTQDAAVSRVVRRLAMDLINVNITYNRDRTAALRQEALASVKPVYFQIGKGEAIIKAGEPVNEGHLRKLAGLNKANPPYSRYMILAGFCLILILLIRLYSLFSETYLDRSKNATEDLILICLFLIGTIIMVRLTSSLSVLMESAKAGLGARSLLFAVPVATCAMLTALMVDPRIAILTAGLTSLVACLAAEGDIYLFAFYLIGGIVGIHGMTRICDRTAVLRAGLVVGLISVVCVLAIKMALGQLTKVQDFYEIGFGFFGGVLSGLLVSGLAPLLERLGYITDVRLIEIANLNHPVLKQMAMEAPGTYHHSIMVGNLVEQAAETIDANPLLAKVGAYYHDIGKVGRKTRPSYFIENQRGGANPHDKLEPSMSALILVSHVKYGVERAREHRLGRPIIDIIQQHHGANLIRFFYNKALERASKDLHPVPEDKYRYPGPRPATKEAALVMLADVVEAACRTLTDPTPARIQKRVHELVIGLFNEGQLDQSNLTLKDLHAVTKSFVRSLQGILHTRITYPADIGVQEKLNGNLHRFETEKDRHRAGGNSHENGKNLGRIGM